MSRIAGTINVQVNGYIYSAVGAFNYNLGLPKSEMLMGHDGPHGHKELPQVAFIEGEFRDSSTLDVAEILSADNATVTIKLANGKTILLRGAKQCSEGTIGTEEANIPVRFEGFSAEEVLP